MQKMKFTTLFRCGCASGDNGSSGYFLEDKMQSLKLQKFCGYIIYIKSVVATILATILFSSGIFYCTRLNKFNQNQEIIEDFTTRAVFNCSGLISLIVGFSYISISFVIIGLALLYLFHGRKLIYKNTYQKKMIIVSIVIECICACAFGEYFVSSLFMGFGWNLIYVVTFIPLLIAQALFTIYFLTRSLEFYHKKQ